KGSASVDLQRLSRTSSQVSTEEARNGVPHLDHVLRVDGTVAFVGLDEVFDLDTTVAQRVDEVVGFGLDHANVVGALDYQERRTDRVHQVDRGTGHHVGQLVGV